MYKKMICQSSSNTGKRASRLQPPGLSVLNIIFNQHSLRLSGPISLWLADKLFIRRNWKNSEKEISSFVVTLIAIAWYYQLLNIHKLALKGDNGKRKYTKTSL